MTLPSSAQATPALRRGSQRHASGVRPRSSPSRLTGWAGHLVREIDALGGEMAIAADKNLIQSRMLNLGKGPAVHSPRAQIDRRDYSAYMKRVLESTENLDLRQGEIVDLAQVHSDALEALKTLPTTDAEEALAKLATAQKEGEVHRPLWQLTTQLEAVYTAETVILATGTFLGGRIYVGDVSYAAGPDGLFPATELSGSLQRLGVQTRRFKTGTPSRVNARSVDLDKLEVQYGDEKLVRFSDDLSFTPENKAVCYITYTGEETREIILANLERSPLYGGKIEGIGPRSSASRKKSGTRSSSSPAASIPKSSTCRGCPLPFRKMFS